MNRKNFTRTVLLTLVFAILLAACSQQPASKPSAEPGAALIEQPTAAPQPTLEVLPTPEVQLSDLVGHWIGGFEMEGVDVLDSAVEFDLALDDNALSGRLTFVTDSNVLQLTDLSLVGTRVQFSVGDGVDALTFDGFVEDGRIAGEVQGAASTRGRGFELYQPVELAGATAVRFEGVYEFEDDGGAVVIIPRDTFLWYVDIESSDYRRLEAVSQSSFLVGATRSLGYPFEGLVTFETNDSGEVIGFSRSPIDAATAGRTPARTATRLDFDAEQVRFPSGDIMLAGRVTMPTGEAPHPAVVLVHGSGRATHTNPYFDVMTAFFVHSGYAVLSYDKRGVGESGGAFNGNAVNDRYMPVLADDALAGVEYLQSFDDIDAERIGLWGISQAGWVIPMAATRSDDVAFVVLTSGPGVAVSIEGYYSSFTNDGGTSSSFSDEEINVLVAEAPPSGYDSIPYAEQMTIPGLWLFGSVDRSVPPLLSIENLQRVKEEGDKDFTFVLFPNGDHGLYQSRNGMHADRPYSKGFVPGLFPTIRDWLAEKVGMMGVSTTSQ